MMFVFLLEVTSTGKHCLLASGTEKNEGHARALQQQQLDIARRNDTDNSYSCLVVNECLMMMVVVQEQGQG